MTLREALRQAEARIAGASIPDARLEAEILLMHALSLPRAELYARLGESLPPATDALFQGLVGRRLRREPAAYILGRAWFYGIELAVDPRVLIPRPETELLVETALTLVKERFGEAQPCTLADVGTGSGAIAVALALNAPRARVWATDSSPGALGVARFNCHRHGVHDRVTLVAGDLLGPLRRPVDIIVANLPYVKDADLPGLAPEIREFEPRSALAGGADGLDLVRRLLAGAADHLRRRGAVLLEIGLGQGEAAVSAARAHLPGTAVDLVRDFAGIERVLRAIA